MLYLRYILLAIVSLLLCTACGFHLNGIGSEPKHIPVNSIYIQCDNVAICPELVETIKQKELTHISDNTLKANAVVKVFNELTNRQPLNYNNLGHVSAYTLSYQITVQVWQYNQQVANDINISVQENMQYTDSLILASNQEEAQLWGILHQKAVNQLVNHLVYFKYLSHAN